MDKKVHGIVIKTVDYKESDKMITLFTLEEGIIGANVKGVKKAGAKLTFCAEPFCFAEYVLAENSGRNTVIEATQLDSFYAVRLDLNKYYTASVVAEFIGKILWEQTPIEELFHITVKTLENLSYGEISPVTALNKFFIESLRVIGYEIRFTNCSRCGNIIKSRAFFDFEKGCAVCENCRIETDLEMNEKTYLYLQAVSSASLDGLAGIKETTMIEKKSLKLMDYYVKLKEETEIVSLKELINIIA